ncbi:Fur family zinc uptake transcriptional regulator [Roseiarcus fermentans]|uniref:Ferric uptake regulation protein n=1 Tax=Roseiarcus fermentans TaxID=1473586 RepID=A0A366FRU5_9HYPH|nr:Fur family transcriptional regulator [Roseiarcus fermentans]RBP16780.1 Fur family zinc uptake transcriptional regulator [Roseiarcus fermentans]
MLEAKHDPACGCAHDPTTWAARVEQACERDGLQLTPLRRRVLDIFSASAAPLGAYAILDELSRREGKHVAPPTVYRTLDFLLERGFVHKIESLNAYAPCEHLGHAHHGMLLICEACGRSEEIEDDEVIRVLAAKAAGSGFRLRRVMVEAKGLCRRCGGESPRPAA